MHSGLKLEHARIEYLSACSMAENRVARLRIKPQQSWALTPAVVV